MTKLVALLFFVRRHTHRQFAARRIEAWQSMAWTRHKFEKLRTRVEEIKDLKLTAC